MPLYVYALVELQPRVAPRLRAGVTRERVEIRPAGRIGAIAGSIDAPPDPTEAAVRAHDAVVRQAARVWAAILPVRFGTVVGDDRALRRLLADRRTSLTRALAHVRGGAQMTIRVFGAAPVPDKLPDRSGGAAVDGNDAAGPGTRYLRHAAAVDARLKRLPELDPLRDAVSQYVRAELVEPHSSPPLIASVFHLIDRARARGYTRRARQAASDARLRVAISGPFPPYAFGPEDL